MPTKQLFPPAVVLVFLLAPLVQGQSYISGIDVSRWQGSINWSAIRADGIEFAFLRATKGEAYIDPLFLANARDAIDAGVLVGPYHYCRLNTNFGSFTAAEAIADATGEANHFLSVIKPYYESGQMLPPVADVEGFPTFPSNAVGKAYNSAWVQQFSDVILAELGVRPLIYTNVSQANTYYTTSVASSHDLWLARWTHDPNIAPVGPNPAVGFDPWTFWQWTDGSQGYRVDGIPGAVDGDVYGGTRSQLEAMLHGNGPLGGLPDGRIVLTDFDGADFDSTESEGIEGYFMNSPTFSGSTSPPTVATFTATLDASQAQEGSASQRIVADAATGSTAWTLRHVSGIGAAVAQPSGNLALDSTGSIGFWLNTTSPNVTVQLLIDDSGAELETSTVANVLADGQWHLYQWDFDDATQWNSFLAGDGTIDGAKVTIDSIMLKGVGDATVYLDTVAHNPSGGLLPLAGDFNGDFLVDGEDLAEWEAAFATTNNADADGDGDSDGADFLAWQRQITGAAGPTAATVPEPTTLLLAIIAGGIGCSRRRMAWPTRTT